MKTTITTLIGAIALAVVLPACDAPSPDGEPRSLAADAEIELDLDSADAIYRAVEDAEDDHVGGDDAIAVEGPADLSIAVDPSLGCGWEYGVCMSWCFANNISHACFSFCQSEFCD